MLTAKGITKEYPSGGGIFDASFSVPDGEIMAVVGPNGAGKSTLFNTIAGNRTAGKRGMPVKRRFGRQVEAAGIQLFAGRQLPDS
jgi:ABC-type multidrug transport system ATPase subunit